MLLNSLNGWQRLGVFISTLIAVPSFLIGYQDNKSAYVYYDVPEKHQSLQGQKFVDVVYSDAYWETDKLKGCVKSTIRVEGHNYSSVDAAYDAAGESNTSSEESPIWTNATITCEKTTERAAFDAKWFLIVPFLLVFGFGYIVSWIIDGFRKRKK